MEVLLRVVDKINAGDPAADLLCTKAGDVIVIKPDGWSWGAAELTNPEWRIVKLPGIDISVFSDMGDGQYVDDVDAVGNPSKRLVRKRAKALDLSSAFAQNLIASGQVITINVPAQKTQFIAMKIAKALP